MPSAICPRDSVRPEEGVDAAVRPFAEKINIVVGGQRRPVYHLSHKHRLRLCLCYYSVSLNTGGTKMNDIFSYNKILSFPKLNDSVMYKS